MTKKINMGQYAFIEKVKEVHGDIFLFQKTEYVHTHAPIVLTCKKHGDFLKKRAYQVLQGQECPECRIQKLLVKRQNQFIEIANTVHSHKYDYSLVRYKDAKTKVEIICPIHGVFKQRPNTHISKHGCYECAKSHCSDGIYCDNYFKQHKNKQGYLYIIKFFNEEETFIKVGMTKQHKIKKRFSSQVNYRYQILVYQPMSLKRAYLLEQQYKLKYKDHKYTPKIKFGGYTECFKEQILEDIINVKHF